MRIELNLSHARLCLLVDLKTVCQMVLSEHKAPPHKTRFIMVYQQFSHEKKMDHHGPSIFPSYSHHVPIAFPSCSHHVPIILTHRVPIMLTHHFNPSCSHHVPIMLTHHVNASF